MTREGKEGEEKTVIRVLPGDEVDVLIKKYQEELEAKKREKEKAEAAKME